MTVSATKVVEVPETVVTQQAKVTGTAPTPPPPPPPDVPILVATAEPTPPPAAAPAAPAPAALPKTGSFLPLFGLLGLLSLGSSLGLSAFRRIG